jgi:tetratricopeptide (TPR) repeat protein
MCLTRVVLVVFLAAGLIMQAVQSDASPQSASRRSASPQSASQQYWTLQAQVVTDAVLKDAIDLAPLDRALLFGRLAEIWRLKDTSRAQALLQKAITEIEFNPNAESDVDRSKRLSVLTALLTTAAPFDERLTQQLTDLLKSGDDKPGRFDANDTADALAKAALAVLDVDPNRAAALGSASLRAGRSTSFPSLLSRLRSRNQALGAALFDQALVTAGTRKDRDLLASLILIALNGPAPTDETRRTMIRTIEHEFLGGSGEANPNRGCSLATIIAPLLVEFDRLLPQSSANIRRGLIGCQKISSSSDATVERVLDNQPVKTVSDLLDAAGKARTIGDKALLLGRAANLAAQQKKFEQALEILDGLSEEQREALGDVWSDWRWDFAASAAVAKLKADDRQGMEKIISSTPTDLQAFVRVAVSQELADYGDTARAIELLEAARKSFLKSDDIPNVFDWYMSLLSRYGKIAPKEGPEVFREFVTVNNRTKPKPNEMPAVRENLQPLKLPASVVQVDFVQMKDAASALDSRVMRIRARLGLIKSLLESASADTRANSN